MIIHLIIIFIGLYLLVKGADWLVDGASFLARLFNISELAIGLTVVAFGTSAPELVVSVFSAISGHQDLVFGNIIGSNNFNLFFILGLAGLISPLACKPSTVKKEIPQSLLAALILFFLANDFHKNSGSPMLSRGDGLILMAFFLLFLFYVYHQLGKGDMKSDVPAHQDTTKLKIFFLVTGGLLGLAIGGKMVVDGAVALAKAMGISEKLVGLTIVAFGTSLPELATSVVAAMKKKADIAVGNIVGSNIFNIFLILSVSSLIKPAPYDQIFNVDLYFLIGGTTFLLLAMFLGKRATIDRWEAGLLLAAFLVFYAYQIDKYCRIGNMENQNIILNSSLAPMGHKWPENSTTKL